MSETQQQFDECWGCEETLTSIYFDVQMKIAVPAKDMPGGVLNRLCVKCALEKLPGVDEESLDLVCNWRTMEKRGEYDQHYLQIDVNALDPSARELKEVGHQYRILVNGEPMGTYYVRNSELTLEAIPVWLPTMENQIKEAVEKKVGVKVKSVSIHGRDHT